MVIPQKSAMEKLFIDIAGDDMEVDWMELKRILDHSFRDGKQIFKAFAFPVNVLKQTIQIISITRWLVILIMLLWYLNVVRRYIVVLFVVA